MHGRLLSCPGARLFGVEEKSERVADVWLEMNSIPDKAHCPHFRPSFSSLAPLASLDPPSSFCAVVVVPGHGNSQIYIFDALFFDTFFELCERDFAAPHVQVLYLLVLFHFEANADVTLLYFDC